MGAETGRKRLIEMVFEVDGREFDLTNGPVSDLRVGMTGTLKVSALDREADAYRATLKSKGEKDGSIDCEFDLARPHQSLSEFCTGLGEVTQYSRDTWVAAFSRINEATLSEDKIVDLGEDFWAKLSSLVHPFAATHAIEGFSHLGRESDDGS